LLVLLLLLLLLVVLLACTSRLGLLVRTGLLLGTLVDTDHSFGVISNELLRNEALRHHGGVDLGRLVDVDLQAQEERNEMRPSNTRINTVSECGLTWVVYSLVARIFSTLGAFVRFSPYCVSCSIWEMERQTGQVSK